MGLQFPGPLAAFQHHRRQMGRMDQNRAPRGKDRDQAGARAQRRTGGKPRCTGLRRPAGQNDRMTAIIFVARIGGPPERPTP